MLGIPGALIAAVLMAIGTFYFRTIRRIMRIRKLRERKSEILILILPFIKAQDLPGSEPHREIQRIIRRRLRELEVNNVRATIVTDHIEYNDEEAALKIGKEYNASIVVWGEYSSVRVSTQIAQIKMKPSAMMTLDIVYNSESIERVVLFTEKLPEAVRIATNSLLGIILFSFDKYRDALDLVQDTYPEPNNLMVCGKSQITTKYQQIANEMYSHEKCEIFLELLLELQDERKTDPVLNFLAGEMFRMLSKVSDADECYSRVPINSRIALSAYYSRGLMNRSEKKYARAIDDFLLCTRIAPDNAIPHNALGITYYKMGKTFHESAIKAFDKAIQLDSSYANAYSNRGTVYSASNCRPEAERDIIKALSIHPDSANAHNAFALLLSKRGMYEEAFQHFQSAIQSTSTLRDVYHYNRGNIYKKTKQFSKAIEDYEIAISLNEGNASVYNNMGSSYYELGKYHKAIEILTEAINLDGNFANAYANRSLVYEKLGETFLAENDFETAQKLNPKLERITE